MYDFRASQPDELSFRQGDVLKILQNQHDEQWFRAEHNGVTGFVPKNRLQLQVHFLIDFYVPLESCSIKTKVSLTCSKFPGTVALSRETKPKTVLEGAVLKCLKSLLFFLICLSQHTE